jgi:ABC-type amino acid transport substrate-binding protein
MWMRAVLGLLVAGGLAAPARAADVPGLRVPGVIRVLVASDEQPEVFSFKGDGPPGFERELIEGFARARKLEMRVVPVTNWEQIIPQLQKGDGDVIVGIVDTEARRKRVSFTSEIYPVRHVVVTRQPHPPVANVTELRELKIGVIPGTTWAEATAAAGVPASAQVPCADLNDALEALRNGKIAATVMAVFDFALAHKRDKALEAGMFLGLPGTAAWAVRQADQSLLSALDEYIDAVRQSPVRNALTVKYFDEDALNLLRRARKGE